MKITLCAFADEAAKDLNGQVQALQDNNIALLELRNLNGKNIMDFTPDDARQTAAVLAEHGVSVWALGSPVGKVRESVGMDAYLERTKRLCETAQTLQCKNIRAFSFYPRFRSFHEDVVFEKLNALLRCVERYDLRFCHENEKGIYGSTLPRMQALLDAFPSMRFVYDPANFLQCGQSPQETLRALAPRAAYFHIKDASGKKVVPAGFGDGQLKTLIDGLDRDVVFSIEPHLLFFRGSKVFNQSPLANRFDLRTARGRFDCAVAACKALLRSCGYRDCGSYFEK